MSDRRITQEEVAKRTQTANERTSMTITMPPAPENFPQFSQNEANGMQTEENAVSDHLAKTPTEEFAKFNRQVNANGSDVDKSPKQLSGTGNGNEKEMEIKPSTDALGNAPKVKPLTRTNGIKRKKGRRPPFQRYYHCSTKDVDNDNIQTDDEDGDEDKHTKGDEDEFGDENGDDDEPSQSLCKKIFVFGFIKRRQNKKLEKSMVLEFNKSTVSGNILGSGSNSSNPAVTSNLNDMNSNNVRESERLRAGPEEINNGAIVPDPNFNTQVLFSKEKTPPKIIEAEPVSRNITIIHKMVKESPDEPEISTWKLIRHRVSSWTGRLNPFRRWIRSGRDKEARISLRRSEADRTRDSARNIKRAFSSGQNSEEMLLNAHARGTSEVEAEEVIRLSNPVDCVRTCLISKSKSVRSVQPIIEDASNETGESAISGVEATNLRRRRSVRSFAPIIEDASNETGSDNAAPESAQRLQITHEPIYPVPEGATLRRRPRVARLRREFTDSIDEVINSNETPHQMSAVDIQASSASSGYLETITTRNLIGSNSLFNRSQQNLALMPEVADDSIEEDADFGAPLCRHSSREPSAEETRVTESDMNVNQHQIVTSMVVAPAPEEPRGSHILENYTSTIAAINENGHPEVNRIYDARKKYVIKMEPIPESEVEEDSDASQRTSSDPPSLADTMNTSESSMSVQQQSSCGVSRSNANRRKLRSLRFEPYNYELMKLERQQSRRDDATDDATVTSRH
ncbi:hypothetical protein BGAL_0061g00300 [Botrytis galanthina]|uniref:Uncharacterized protein n=1 Tax=Botrytis galanthina TaxID=278940 RepID=A0A4S8RHI9_9HELO|nr:hypothetical protein BGAL_0061g00300 [Botrytis galanthina]